MGGKLECGGGCEKSESYQKCKYPKCKKQGASLGYLTLWLQRAGLVDKERAVFCAAPVVVVDIESDHGEEEPVFAPGEAGVLVVGLGHGEAPGGAVYAVGLNCHGLCVREALCARARVVRNEARGAIAVAEDARVPLRLANAEMRLANVAVGVGRARAQ